jgi:hypothetical protein
MGLEKKMKEKRKAETRNEFSIAKNNLIVASGTVSRMVSLGIVEICQFCHLG